MRIAATLDNWEGENRVTLTTDDRSHDLEVPPKQTGFGSSANGGELLFLALAACYCNDIYREAAKKGIRIERVEVQVEGDFEAEGEPATNVVYRSKVFADATEAEIRELMEQTDKVAEIQNTVRGKTAVALAEIEAVSVMSSEA